MSEDKEKIEVRTATEECICAVVAEAYYMDGGTPEELMEFVEKSPDLSKIYRKWPHVFKAKRSAANDQYHESIDAYI